VALLWSSRWLSNFLVGPGLSAVRRDSLMGRRLDSRTEFAGALQTDLTTNAPGRAFALLSGKSSAMMRLVKATKWNCFNSPRIERQL